MKRKILIISILLILELNAINVKAAIKEHTTTWNCIWFGAYPQTEVYDAHFSHKKYMKNVEGQECGYTAIDAGVKVTIGRVVSTDERNIFGFQDSWTGADKYFQYRPLKWRILKTDGNKALLLSDKIIDQYYMYKPSNTDIGIKYRGLQMDFIWKNSSLRNYMNNVMYEMAFSKDEKKSILDSHVISGFTYKNEKDVTKDKLFILSYDELIKEYGFNTQESLLCKISDYGRASGMAKYDSYGEYGTYFTRSNGYKSYHIQYGNASKDAFCEAYSDAIDGTGSLVRKSALCYNGIRVAMWVDLSNCKYQYAGTVSSDGKINECKFKYSIKLSKVKLKTIKNVKEKAIKIKFHKVKKAKKYKIQYAANRKFKKAQIKKSKKTSKKISKLKLGKIYYVRVCAVNGKNCGKWSKIKKVKIKY